MSSNMGAYVSNSDRKCKVAVEFLDLGSTHSSQHPFSEATSEAHQSDSDM